MDLTPLLTSNLGPVGLVSAAVLLVLLGRLVPRRSVDDAKADAAHWRHAWELSERARQQEAAQTAQMVEKLDVHTRLLESIKALSERGGAS